MRGAPPDGSRAACSLTTRSNQGAHVRWPHEAQSRRPRTAHASSLYSRVKESPPGAPRPSIARPATPSRWTVHMHVAHPPTPCSCTVRMHSLSSPLPRVSWAVPSIGNDGPLREQLARMVSTLRGRLDSRVSAVPQTCCSHVYVMGQMLPQRVPASAFHLTMRSRAGLETQYMGMLVRHVIGTLQCLLIPPPAPRLWSGARSWPCWT